MLNIKCRIDGLQMRDAVNDPPETAGDYVVLDDIRRIIQLSFLPGYGWNCSKAYDGTVSCQYAFRPEQVVAWCTREEFSSALTFSSESNVEPA